MHLEDGVGKGAAAAASPSRGSVSPQVFVYHINGMLHFSSGELTVLLDTSKQRVSNIKASANFKLFGTKDAKALLRNLKSV